MLTRTRATQTYWTCNNKLQEISPQRSPLKKSTVQLSNPSKSMPTDRLRCTFRNKSPKQHKKCVSPKQSQKILLENESISVPSRSLSPECQKKAGNENVKKQSSSSLGKGSHKRSRFSASYTSPAVDMPPLFAEASIIFLIV